MTASTPSSIFKPEPNATHEITLASPNGIEVRGNYGPQMLFSLANHSRMYVPLEVGKEIQSLTLAPGQPFLLTKATRNGQRGFDWKVERKPAEPAMVAPTSQNRPATQLESALKTAIAAAKEAEQYGTAIGYTVRFSEDSIRAMAITILIGTQRAA
jgi:hypothetical protein